MRDYRELRVWNLAHELTLNIYRVTSAFPDQETYGLTAHLRSSAISIEANIAEGAGRRTRNDYGRFLDIALGSINETERHVLIARDLDFMPTDSAVESLLHIDTVRRMLLGLRRKLT